jgi:hypothetical protein
MFVAGTSPYEHYEALRVGSLRPVVNCYVALSTDSSAFRVRAVSQAGYSCSLWVPKDAVGSAVRCTGLLHCDHCLLLLTLS